MSLEWNPDDPDLLGVQHGDAGIRHYTIDDYSKQWGLRFTSQHTGTMSGFDLYAGVGATAPTLDARFASLPRPMVMDIVDAGDEATSAVAQTQVAPSAIVASPSMFNQSLGAPTLAAITSPDDGNFMVASAVNALVDISFDTAAFPLTEQILRVGLRIDSNATFRLSRIDPSGGIRWYKDIPTLGASPYAQFLYQGDVKVDHGATAWSWWTAQDIRDLRSGGTRKFRIQCRAGPGIWKLDYVRLFVIHVTERRVGVGIGSPVSAQRWFNFAFLQPDGTGLPNLVSGNEYTGIVRRALTTSPDPTMSHATLPWRHLKGEAMADVWDTYEIDTSVPTDVANSPVFLSGNIKTDGLGERVDGIATGRMISGGVVQNEAQPYELQRGALVYEGFVASQTVVVPIGTEVYGQVMAMVGRKNLSSSEPLRVRVLDNASLVVFNEIVATVSNWNEQPIGAQALDDQGYTYKRMRFRFEENLDLAPGGYTIEFYSDSPAESQWRIGALIASDHFTNETFDGANAEASGSWMDGTRVTDLTGAWDSDLQATLATVPDPVTGVATDVGVVTAHHTSLPESHNCHTDGCADHGLPFIRISWDATDDLLTTHYEIQRQTVARPEWVYVQTVQERLTTSWDDQEPPIGVQTCYRIRSVRSDDIAGQWSDVVCETIPRGHVAMSFSSNAATGMGCTYSEVFDSQTVVKAWTFLESGDNEYRQMYGEDGQRVFRPIERRGISFKRKLMLSGVRSVANPSLALADPLRDLAWAPIPYVCVRDDEGNVFYATVEVGEIENERSSMTSLWYMPIQVTETTGPYAGNTSDPQVTVADVGLD